MSEKKAFKVLLDNSIRQRAIMGEHCFRRTKDNFQGHPHEYLQQHIQSPPRRTDWLQPEIDLLPEIAKLIREGSLSAFSTYELYAEAFHVMKTPTPLYIDAFENCEIGRLPSPFDRTKFGLSIEQFLSKSDVIDFCKSIFLSPSTERIEQFIEGMRRNPRHSLSPFEERCLRKAHVFKHLCRGLDEKHYPDALHLWTAEESGLDAFLTLDKKFRNVVQRQKVDFSCQVIFPSEVFTLINQSNQ